MKAGQATVTRWTVATKSGQATVTRWTVATTQYRRNV